VHKAAPERHKAAPDRDKAAPDREKAARERDNRPLIQQLLIILLVPSHQ
jgi:hypothetical protein